MRVALPALLLLLASCNSTTAIEGDDNDNNKVVVGNNNVITFNGKDYNRPINKDLGINISTNNDITKFVRESLGEPDASEDVSRIKYKAVQTGGAVIIKPDVETVDLFEKGGPVTNVFSETNLVGVAWGYFGGIALTFPNLDFKMVNNSQNTVFFNRVVFNIRSSKKVRTPLIVPIIDGLEGTAAGFGLVNEGWFDLISCEVAYNIYPPNTTVFDYNNTPFSATVTADLNKNRETYINLDPAFQKLGVDTKLLKEYISHGSDKVKQVLGRFYASKDGMLEMPLAAGKIRCRFLDENGIEQTKEVTFYVPVDLERGYGAPSPVSDQFNAKFETDKQNYTVEVPISNTLKPTESDRINIMIAADQTSVHDFSAKLYYNDSSYYETGPIQLHYLLPYSARDLYSDALKSLKKKTLYK